MIKIFKRLSKHCCHSDKPGFSGTDWSLTNALRDILRFELSHHLPGSMQFPFFAAPSSLLLNFNGRSKSFTFYKDSPAPLFLLCTVFFPFRRVSHVPDVIIRCALFGWEMKTAHALVSFYILNSAFHFFSCFRPSFYMCQGPSPPSELRIPVTKNWQSFRRFL